MLVDDARNHAEALLGPLGARWRHTCGVASQARRVGDRLGDEDRSVLEAAAWLHDIGYSLTIVETRFHPLDGARWLSSMGERRLAGLVAHHTGAVYGAARLGLGGALAEFEDEVSVVSAALAYCDLTTGPHGQRVTPTERLADIEARHGVGSVVVESLHEAWPSLMASVQVVEEQLLGAVQPM